jgi:hypothetical protein
MNITVELMLIHKPIAGYVMNLGGMIGLKNFASVRLSIGDKK